MDGWLKASLLFLENNPKLETLLVIAVASMIAIVSTAFFCYHIIQFFGKGL